MDTEPTMPQITKYFSPNRITELQTTRSPELLQTMILEYRQFAENIAKRYSHNPKDFGDVVSVAYLALVQVMHRVMDKGIPHNNLTGYIYGAIKNSILDYHLKNNIIRVPLNRKDWPTVQTLDSWVEEEGLLDNHISELIEYISRSDRDTFILTKLSEGYYHKDIAKMVGLSRVRITRLCKEYKERYNDKRP